jgi:hypothetical protein
LKTRKNSGKTVDFGVFPQKQFKIMGFGEEKLNLDKVQF